MFDQKYTPQRRLSTDEIVDLLVRTVVSDDLVDAIDHYWDRSYPIHLGVDTEMN